MGMHGPHLFVRRAMLRKKLDQGALGEVFLDIENTVNSVAAALSSSLPLKPECGHGGEYLSLGPYWAQRFDDLHKVIEHFERVSIVR